MIVSYPPLVFVLLFCCALFCCIRLSVVFYRVVCSIVKGAHEGAGLGNKFLTNIRQTDAIVHVVRCFEDTNIIHVDDTVDPLRDVDVINLELILADIVQVEKRMAKLKKDAKLKKLGSDEELGALQKVRCLTRML